MPAALCTSSAHLLAVLSRTSCFGAASSLPRTIAQIPHRFSGLSVPSPSVENSKSAQSPGNSGHFHFSELASPEPSNFWVFWGFGCVKTRVTSLSAKSWLGLTMSSSSLIFGALPGLWPSVFLMSKNQSVRTPASCKGPRFVNLSACTFPSTALNSPTSEPTRDPGEKVTKASGNNFTWLGEALLVKISVTSDLARSAPLSRRSKSSRLLKAASRSLLTFVLDSTPPMPCNSSVKKVLEGPLVVATTSKYQLACTPAS
mmetsp:Transcript_38832/g.84540  ORF Transcript_38832/g.84540 Transcript_38832/m.84540 type:complete len:258 (-) Transcript_38832:79-852(-)